VAALLEKPGIYIGFNYTYNGKITVVASAADDTTHAVALSIITYVALAISIPCLIITAGVYIGTAGSRRAPHASVVALSLLKTSLSHTCTVVACRLRTITLDTRDHHHTDAGQGLFVPPSN